MPAVAKRLAVHRGDLVDIGERRYRVVPHKHGWLTLQRTSTTEMAAAAQKLDVRREDLVEIEGRRYDVVSDRQGGLTLEPAITVFADELHRRHGTRPVTPEEFDQFLGQLPHHPAE